jgi:hypothetical protein
MGSAWSSRGPALRGPGEVGDWWEDEPMCSRTGATSYPWEVRKRSASATQRAKISSSALTLPSEGCRANPLLDRGSLDLGCSKSRNDGGVGGGGACDDEVNSTSREGMARPWNGAGRGREAGGGPPTPTPTRAAAAALMSPTPSPSLLAHKASTAAPTPSPSLLAHKASTAAWRATRAVRSPVPAAATARRVAWAPHRQGGQDPRPPRPMSWSLAGRRRHQCPHRPRPPAHPRPKADPP